MLCELYLSKAVVLSFIQLFGLQSTRLLCSSHSGKNTGEGYHFLLQVIFLTQGLNPHFLCLLHWQAESLPTEPSGSPFQPPSSYWGKKMQNLKI